MVSNEQTLNIVWLITKAYCYRKNNCLMKISAQNITTLYHILSSTIPFVCWMLKACLKKRKWLNNSFSAFWLVGQLLNVVTAETEKKSWRWKWQTSFGKWSLTDSSIQTDTQSASKHDPKGHESEPNLVWQKNDDFLSQAFPNCQTKVLCEIGIISFLFWAPSLNIVD